MACGEINMMGGVPWHEMVCDDLEERMFPLKGGEWR